MLQDLEKQEAELRQRLLATKDTKHKAEAELIDFKSMRNEQYDVDMSRADLESRLNKSFRDPAILESPKSQKVTNKDFSQPQRGAATQKKPNKYHNMFSQSAGGKKNNDLVSMQIGRSSIVPDQKPSTIQPYDKSEKRQEVAKGIGEHFRRSQNASPFLPATNHRQLEDNKSQMSGLTQGTQKTAASTTKAQ